MSEWDWTKHEDPERDDAFFYRAELADSHVTVQETNPGDWGWILRDSKLNPDDPLDHGILNFKTGFTSADEAKDHAEEFITNACK